VSDIDDLDDLDLLERELGPSLRLALRRAAAGITAEQELDGRTGATLVDVQPMWRTRSGRRRWVIAAVAAALLVVAVVAVETTRDENLGTVVPARPRPTTTSAPPTVDDVMPRPGAALTTPETGELVASVAVFHEGAWNLYADGRLISIDDHHCCDWREQRLTPEGVERVRLAFLASGLFDPNQLPVDPPPGDDIVPFAGSCPCVRDGGRLLTAAPKPARAPRPVETELVAYLRDLASSVPVSEWVDEAGRQFVAARYAVCFFQSAPRGIPEPLADLPAVVASLPSPAAEMLAGREPTSHLDDPIHSSCVDVAAGEARAVAEALVESFGLTDIGTATSSWGPGIRATVAQPVPMSIDITFWPLLPAGGLRIWGG
jgi:hypothetical protein